MDCFRFTSWNLQTSTIITVNFIQAIMHQHVFLSIPAVNTFTYGQDSFSFNAAPQLWNSLPEPLHIKHSSKIQTFKSNLKTFLRNFIRPSKKNNWLASLQDHWKSARHNNFLNFYFHRTFLFKNVSLFNTILRRQKLVKVWISCPKTCVFCIPICLCYTWTIGCKNDNK